MNIESQVRRLVNAGVHEAAGLSAEGFADHAANLPDEPGVLAVHPSLISARDLVALLDRDGKPGFVVSDMTDLPEFTAIEGLQVPDSPLYLLHDVDRGDHMSNWSPNEALPAIEALGRSPLTVHEGLSWIIHEPKVLERNHCFMTIGSRKVGAKGLDARTPAIWISNGTGRDGKRNMGAAKLGWCWAGNRHTWLGFASTSARTG